MSRRWVEKEKATRILPAGSQISRVYIHFIIYSNSRKTVSMDLSQKYWNERHCTLFLFHKPYDNHSLFLYIFLARQSTTVEGLSNGIF